MNTLKTFIASAAIAASTLGLFAVSTSAHAGISTCGAWRCGYNGVELNGVQFNDIKWNGIQFNDLKWNGVELNNARPGDVANGQTRAERQDEAGVGSPMAVTLPGGETLLLK